MIVLPALNITVKGNLFYFAGVVPEDSMRLLLKCYLWILGLTLEYLCCSK